MVVQGKGPAAARPGLFILAPAGQVILARHGFEAPALPKEGRPVTIAAHTRPAALRGLLARGG